MNAREHLQARAQQWNVAVLHTQETPTSIIAFGTRANKRVVIKVVKQQGDEWHSNEVLRAFGGSGMVAVYESEPGAMLLERLEPGTELVEIVRSNDDEAATKVLADVMRELAHHTALGNCPTVFDWSQSFDRYLKSGDQRISATLVGEARELFLHLAHSQKATMLLHGDLQHYNVLFDSTRGWVGIDPKGVVGELEYEVGAILRNPVELPQLFSSTAVIESRLKILSNELNLNYDRMLAWSFAQAVLSAIWDVEDGYPVEQNHSALALASVLRPMVVTS